MIKKRALEITILQKSREKINLHDIAMAETAYGYILIFSKFENNVLS
jgi:hypothetical protein